MRGLVVETTGLNDLVIDVELVSGTCEHGFLDTLLGDEPQNAHDLRLTDTMRTILRLKIGVRVPITVEAAERRVSEDPLQYKGQKLT